MSHQSGIKVSSELADLFANAVAQGNVRVIKVSIDKESLVSNGTSPVRGSFEQDYTAVEDYLKDDTTPSYILVRLDEKDGSGEYKWVFLAYVPDKAKVRDKMVYASTRATLKKDLGDYRFVDTINGTAFSDLSYDGYKKHLIHKASEAPLTQRERELAEIKAEEARTAASYQGTASRQTYTPRISSPLTDAAKEALAELAKAKQDRQFNTVSLCLRDEKAEVEKTTAATSVSDMKNTLSKSQPRFTFFAYDHTRLGESKTAIVFIYSCPPSSGIRDKMLYSCSKTSVVLGSEAISRLKTAIKFEVSDPVDFDDDFLLDRLYPAHAIHASISSGTSRQPVSLTTSDSDTPSGIVQERIQMLGANRGGFKRPVAPNRRKPTTIPCGQD